jgi:hypothetical protein
MEGSQPTLGEETRLPEKNPRLSVNFWQSVNKLNFYFV